MVDRLERIYGVEKCVLWIDSCVFTRFSANAEDGLKCAYHASFLSGVWIINCITNSYNSFIFLYISLIVHLLEEMPETITRMDNKI